jgi:hypothetical protein
MAMWEAYKHEAGAQYIHKGRCDEINDPGRKRFLLWVDADVHLVYLLGNFGLRGKHLADAERRAVAMSE